jgi:pyruvate dehydrogenase E2 component (dihydrolipoamide acetyltransferase)
VSEVRAKVGDTLKVGDVIIVLDKGAGDGEKKEEKSEAVETKVEAPAEPKRVEQKKEEAPAPKKTEPESKAEVKEIAAKRDAESSRPEEKQPPRDEARPAGSVRAAPSVRKLAREIGIDIGAVPASSPGAAISADDVKAYARTLRTGGGPAGETIVPRRSTDTGGLPNFERWGAVTREKMSTVRRLTAESMARSWGAVPHVTQNDKADITELEKFRKEHAKAAEREGGKLTVTAILVRIVAEGLKKFPQFNTSVDAANSEILYKQYYNIGVAVDTEWGLLVPSIKNADRKGLFEIASELADLSDRARQRKTTLDELQGSCFTITNLGGIGGTSFSPIVNLPEVAILGVSRAQIEPVFIGDEFVARTMMPISLSYDHRVIDGADAARFARWICGALEQPLTIFLD